MYFLTLGIDVIFKHIEIISWMKFAKHLLVLYER